ncbi:MAG: zinc-ribbon domain-containing protein [Desulfuromonadaceae bacterium]|nr:zinc-ribbon domain-containing protein [Desulfuromonadaceae bacterium]
MKISCPKCNASGTIPDHEVPESGRFISCPRCNEGFTITKPRSGADVYLVDTCSSCSYSTFGEETFSTCPKCGISVKTFVERQREEQLQKRNQELLGRKLNNVDTSTPPPEDTPTPVADFIENLHPVNLISWSVAAAAVIIIGFGLWGIIGYDTAAIQARLLEERDEQVTGIVVFFQYGLLQWIKLMYGLTALAVSVLFFKRLKSGLNAMSILLRVTIVLVPVLYGAAFVQWIIAPIAHTVRGYLIEFLNVLFMSALVGVPLYLLERFLHERKITSIVKL